MSKVDKIRSDFQQTRVVLRGGEKGIQTSLNEPLRGLCCLENTVFFLTGVLFFRDKVGECHCRSEKVGGGVEEGTEEGESSQIWRPQAVKCFIL